MKYIIYCCTLFFAFVLPCSAQSLSGIWENTERFIEYTKKTEPQEESGIETGTFTMILKTYYRFVYEDMGSYPVTIAPQENLPNVYDCAIQYPYAKQPTQTAIWVYKDSLFTSFYQKIPHTVTAGTSEAERVQSTTNNQEIARTGSSDKGMEYTNSDTAHLLDGFWIEQGFRKGILIYPQETPEFFDAFFFRGNRYIKFRYWKGKTEYKEQYAHFTTGDEQQVAVPKMIKYADIVYRCITDNGSKLKNYEQGAFTLTVDKAGYYFSILPESGGPGTHAVGDTYPHHQYPQIKDLPLYCEKDSSIFAFGVPFLTRSAVTNLQDEVKKHNSLKRKPSEPLLKADELDFYWDRIKEIRKQP